MYPLFNMLLPPAPRGRFYVRQHFAANLKDRLTLARFGFQNMGANGHLPFLSRSLRALRRREVRFCLLVSAWGPGGSTRARS